MAIWPVSLPQRMLVDGYREQPPDNIVRTQMDAGPPRARRRFTAGIRPTMGFIACTPSQVATLDTFYVTTLCDGTLPFDWINSRTGAAATYRFRSVPRYEPQGTKELYRVSLELEQLP